MKKTFYLFVVLVASIVFLSPLRASAASLNLAPNKINIAIGDTVKVDVHVNSENAGVNAFQATLNFPKDILQAQSIDKTDSVVNFWLQEPAFSNDVGQIKFIGGSTSGLFGQSLQITSIVFKAVGSGQANLVFSDGAVTASDGSGTNVLSAMNGVQISVVPKSGVVAPPSAAAPITQITRPTAPAAGLPAKPTIEVPLYPDPTAWYDLIAPFLARWTLPGDVSAVAAVIDKFPTTNPTTSRGLFNNETFNALPDGISYLHVRFRNSVGWGPTAHYRLAIDSVPPIAFNIQVSPAASTTDPNPVINYKTADALSGLKGYSIQLDNTAAVETQNDSFTFTKLSPGQHTIRVAAIDNAGNQNISTLNIETLPLPSPALTSVTGQVFVGEGGLRFQGVSLASFVVNVFLKSKAGNIIASTEAAPDQNGNFSGEFNNPLKQGDYYIEAIAGDSRGAVSLPTRSTVITAKERPVLTIGGLEVTQSGMIGLLLAMIIVGVLFGWVLMKEKNTTRGRRILIAQRDIVAVFGLIKKDVNKMMQNYKDQKISEREASEMAYILKRIQGNIEKLSKYLIENIGEINQ